MVLLDMYTEPLLLPVYVFIIVPIDCLINIHVPFKFTYFSSLLPATVNSTTTSPTVTTNMPDTNRTDKQNNGKKLNVTLSLLCNSEVVMHFKIACEITCVKCHIKRLNSDSSSSVKSICAE